jgi:hypothetical protein
MGYDELLTGHGIRATISTALNEIGYPKVWVDAQLSHCDPNKVSGTYNHALYVEPRRQMMQDWANRLDLLEQGQLQRASKHLTLRFDGIPIPERDEFVEKNKKAKETIKSPISKFRHSFPLTDRAKPASVATISNAQRERMEMLQMYESPYNLPVARFAKLEGKSCDQIHREIGAGKLLALKIGNRGHRIPDWQLDPIKNQFTNALKSTANGFDAWRLYRILTQRYELLKGRSLVEVVTVENFDEVIAVVHALLHIRENN